MFMQNKPNSGSSRPRHWRAGDAGSRHAEKLGPRWIGRPRLARNGTGRPGYWTTRVQRVPPEEWRVASGEWRVADGGCRADDEYGVSLGGCVVGNSSEPMAQAHPDVPAEEDQEPKKSLNKANLETTQASLPQKVESGLTSPAGRKQSQLLRGGRNQARRCRNCTVLFTSSTIRDIMRGGQGCRLICHCQGSSRPRAGK